MKPPTPARRWNSFLARFTPDVAAKVRRILARLRKRLPGATELVYDNYNALVMGFGPTDRAGDAVFSIAVYPRWVNLFFLQGAALADPKGILKGQGSQVRHITLDDPKMLDDPAVSDLMNRALRLSPKPINATAGRVMIIKAVSVRQRSRRP